MLDTPNDSGESTPQPDVAKKPRKHRAKADVASLVSPEAMGGIIGGGGYYFQKRYITCRIVEWLLNPKFQELLHEGHGDVDIRYHDGQVEWREHIQVKDHEVSVSELRMVLKKFVELDTSGPKLYRSFTLACPSLSPPARWSP